MAIPVILRGETAKPITLRLADGYDYAGCTLAVDFCGAVSSFGGLAPGGTLSLPFTDGAAAGFPLGTSKAFLTLRNGNGEKCRLPWAQIKVTDSPDELRDAAASIDVDPATFVGEILPARFTDEDVRSRLNAIINWMKRGAVAMLLALALPGIADVLTVQTAPKGTIYNDEQVVTNVTFDAAGLATKGEVPGTVSNIVTKTYVEELGISGGGAEVGNYANVSNRAMNAVQKGEDLEMISDGEEYGYRLGPGGGYPWDGSGWSNFESFFFPLDYIDSAGDWNWCQIFSEQDDPDKYAATLVRQADLHIAKQEVYGAVDTRIAPVAALAANAAASASAANNNMAQCATKVELNAHAGSTNIHVTAAEKTAWNAKQPALPLEQGKGIPSLKLKVAVSGSGGTYADGSRAVSLGYGTKANGNNSMAANNQTQASGQNSAAFGYKTIATNESEFAVGLLNNPHAGAAGTRFSVGIGVNAGLARTNAFEIMSNGDLYVRGIGGYTGGESTIPANGVKSLQTVIDDTDSANAATRAIVATWENFLDGSNVVFSITNYISGTYSLDAAKMTIKELRDGEYREVYNSRDEILLHIQDFKNNDFKNATNQVIGAVNAAIGNKADRDWGKYTSAGGEAPENTVYMTAPNTVFAGGLEYERVAVGEGTICVLTTHGAPVWTQGDEGTFKFQDDGGTNYFGFAKTDSYTIGANTDGITVQSGIVTLTYNITMSGRPCVWYKSDLANNAPWEQLNLPDGSPVAGASHTVTWEQNPPANTQVCYINVGNQPQGFFRATVEVAGEAKFMTNMPADLSGGIICPNTATGVNGVIKPTFNGSTVIWTWSAN